MSDIAKRLLIVDDDPGIRSQLKWAFLDYQIYTADSRMEAIHQFDKYKPCIVTLDLGLPPNEDGESEGFSILEYIMQSAPTTKVVIVSGSDKLTNSQKAVDSGAFAYYSKPVNIDQLKLIIEQAYQVYTSINCKK